VQGWPGTVQPNDICAVVCHSDLERTGWFECSDALINRLHDNVVWSMRGNFLDVPTDCPQRDERLGWTGDIQVFAPTAAFMYDCTGFLTSWLVDLALEQTPAGNVPLFVPNIADSPNSPAAAWGDAAVFVPWVLYQRFADVDILRSQFDSMRAWVDLIANITGESLLWDRGIQFGDWLDPAAPPDRPGQARTPAYVVATAYFARSAELVGKIAGILGRSAEEGHYLVLAAKVREAFNKEYVTPAGRMISDSATAYALALQFDLLPDEPQRQHAGKRLAAVVRANRYRISTGFVGTPLICDALCSAGEYQAAFRLLTQRECPSWLYPVAMGATTIWERWDSLLPDGSVNPGEMTSFNHYALGAIGDWLQRSVAGLTPSAPGYRRLDIRPRPGGGLTSACARHRSPYGMAACCWKIEAGVITVEVEVPPNSTAQVTLPEKNEAPIEVGSGSYRWSYAYPDLKETRPALTLDSTFAEMVDDSATYARIMKLLSQHNPELADRMEGQDSITLRQAVSTMPRAAELLGRLESALSSQSSDR
jgi:alpha-L-rhamnosidase